MPKNKSNISIGAKASIAYAASSFISKGTGIITIPIFTRLLSTSEMGVYTTYISWLAIFEVLTCMGLNSGSFNIGLMKYKNKRKQYLSSILTLSSFCVLAFGIIAFLFRRQLTSFMDIPSKLIFFMMVYLFFSPALNFWMMSERYEYRCKAVTVINVLSSLLTAALSITSVFYFHSHYPDVDLGYVRIISSYIVPLIICIALYFVLMGQGRQYINLQLWKNSLVLSLPLMLHSLAKQILDLSDRTMISQLRGRSEVGIYGVLYSISSLSLILWTAINASLIPFIFENMKKGKKGEHEINNVIIPIMLVYGVACIFLTLIAPEIVRILATKEYYNAIYMMPPVAAGIFFTSLYNIYSNILLYYEKTTYIMLATATAAVTNIVLNFMFIPKYGFVAAAYTTLVAYFLLAIMQGLFVKKIRKEEKNIFNEKVLWVSALFVVLSCLLCNILYLNTIIRILAIGTLLILLIWKRKPILKVVKNVLHSSL